ncbi:MAG: ABC transporter permease [Pirellulaceae bacterium]|jgi:ABC-2 type transport system permease protein|nr:ABC transporter permease [Planctomycetaceae bacterium]MDB4863587.1 ABC-2 family transporter protein [Pirellulaceae bacterium]
MAGYRPSYLNVFLTFARNSLVRDMSFRTNFILQCISTISWTVMNIGFYLIVFQYTDSIGKGTGWGRDEFFVFLATTWIINSLVQTFFMPNAQQFSELIRSGNLDFALLKPIDTQFVISFPRVDWAALSNLFMGITLLFYSLYQLTTRIESPLVLEWRAILMYPFYIACGTVIMYSVMITLASTSVWLGRNQTLYNFWFYITNFSRYPMEIYKVGWGIALWAFFTFLIPVLLVVNIPARIMARPLNTMTSQMWQLACFTILASLLCFLFSRRVFVRALKSYRSASS